jgi:uroporphyrinogen decarboxylase
LGGTYVSGINIKAYKALRVFLGMPEINTAIMDVIQQIVWVDDDVIDRLRADVKNVSLRFPSNYRPNIEETADHTYFYDEFKLGWRMPKDGGLYYDLFHNPLAGNITVEDVNTFPWPDPLDPARFIGLRERARSIIEDENRAVTIGWLHAGMMELFAFLRGFPDYFSDFAANQKLAGVIMDRVLEMQLAYWNKIFDTVGEYVDVVMVHDDFAGQNEMLISPKTYRTMCKPRHKQLISFMHSRSNAKVFFHSCGSIRPVIPDLIEIGVDIINPVQVSSRGMDTAELKREFGRDLAFWGGGIDTQRVLGTGTPQQIRDEVTRRLADLMPEGGFIFTPVHNIQANVPPENIMAMWETLQEYGGYRR